MTISASNSQPPEGNKNKKKALAAIVTAIAAKTLGTLAANYLRAALQQMQHWLTSESHWKASASCAGTGAFACFGVTIRRRAFM